MIKFITIKAGKEEEKLKSINKIDCSVCIHEENSCESVLWLFKKTIESLDMLLQQKIKFFVF